jgi:hypothetical protein
VHSAGSVTVNNGGNVINLGHIGTLSSSGSVASSWIGTIDVFNAVSGTVTGDGYLRQATTNSSATLINGYYGVIENLTSGGLTANSGIIENVTVKDNMLTNNADGEVISATIQSGAKLINNGFIFFATWQDAGALQNNKTGRLAELTLDGNYFENYGTIYNATVKNDNGYLYSEGGALGFGGQLQLEGGLFEGYNNQIGTLLFKGGTIEADSNVVSNFILPDAVGINRYNSNFSGTGNQIDTLTIADTAMDVQVTVDAVKVSSNVSGNLLLHTSKADVNNVSFGTVEGTVNNVSDGRIGSIGSVLNGGSVNNDGQIGSVGVSGGTVNNDSHIGSTFVSNGLMNNAGTGTADSTTVRGDYRILASDTKQNVTDKDVLVIEYPALPNEPVKEPARGLSLEDRQSGQPGALASYEERLQVYQDKVAEIEADPAQYIKTKTVDGQTVPATVSFEKTVNTTVHTVDFTTNAKLLNEGTASYVHAAGNVENTAAGTIQNAALYGGTFVNDGKVNNLSIYGKGLEGTGRIDNAVIGSPFDYSQYSRTTSSGGNSLEFDKTNSETLGYDVYRSNGASGEKYTTVVDTTIYRTTGGWFDTEDFAGTVGNLSFEGNQGIIRFAALQADGGIGFTSLVSDGLVNLAGANILLDFSGLFAPSSVSLDIIQASAAVGGFLNEGFQVNLADLFDFYGSGGFLGDDWWSGVESVAFIGATDYAWSDIGNGVFQYGGDDDGGNNGENETPEPATMLIIGLGLAGLGLARRWRK